MADFDGVIYDSLLGYYADPDGVAPPPSTDPSFGIASSGVAYAAAAAGAEAYDDDRDGVVGDAPVADRVHEHVIIRPALIDLGHVTDDIEENGYIWNAYTTTPATLQLISSEGAAGVEVSGVDPLDVLAPLEDVELTYAVAAKGAITILATFSFAFDLSTVSQTLMGSRGLVILQRPRANGYAERWIFETEVVRTAANRRWAASLGDADDPPRVVITLPLSTLSPDDRRRLENTLRFGGEYSLACPLWFSLSRLTAATDGTETIACPTTERRFVAGDNVLLLSRSWPRVASWAVRQIDEVQAAALVLASSVDLDAFAVGDFVVPLVEVALPETTELRHILTPYADGTFELEGLS